MLSGGSCFHLPEGIISEGLKAQLRTKISQIEEKSITLSTVCASATCRDVFFDSQMLKREKEITDKLVNHLEKRVRDQEKIIEFLEDSKCEVKDSKKIVNKPENPKPTFSAAVKGTGPFPKMDKSTRQEDKSVDGQESHKIPKEKHLKTARILGVSQEEDTNVFGGADRKAWLYVGRAKSSSTPKDLQVYLKKRFPNEDFIVEEIQKHASNTSANKSFKETGAKKIQHEKEELGVKVYEMQQVVTKQQKTLDSVVAELETISCARQEVEKELKERKEVHKIKKQELMEAENEDLDLRKEVESTNFLIHQMSKYENTLESDITVRKRMLEKSLKDKKKLLGEKRQQDVLIYRLMTRIWDLKTDLEKMDVHLKVKEVEREEMAQAIALGNTNIEAIAAEHRSLMHSWNSVVVAVANRDKVLSCLNAQLHKQEEQFKNVVSEIEQVKKLGQKEMQKNEKLTLLKNRVVADIQHSTATLEVQTQKKTELEKQLCEAQGIKEHIEKDIEKLTMEMNAHNAELSELNHEFDKLNAQKAVLEEEILRNLEDQTTNDKAALHLHKKVQKLRDERRAMEITLAQGEAKTAGVLTEVEVQKAANKETKKLLKQVEGELTALEKEADRYEDEIKKSEFLYAKKQRDIDLLNKKLMKIMATTGSTSQVSPLEEKIMTLEKDIQELQEENKKLQQYWMREQQGLLVASEQRQEQIYNNNLLRKQILIMEQKNLKVTDELENYKKQTEKVNRNINVLRSRLSNLSEAFCKKKGLANTLDKDNDAVRQEYVHKLKDAELECLKLESEIAQIEDDKVCLSKELIEKNREALEWEKKFKLAKETKEMMKQERGSGGELSNMRAEIHRMHVRYSQLKKAQDKLVTDLEHCVVRREAIVTGAEAREKRTKGGVDKTRINFNRKLDEMRNKIKQMNNETEVMKKKIERVETEKRMYEFEIESVKKEIETTRNTTQEMKEEMEEAKTQLHMNFELLLHLQKKLALYTDVQKGRKPYMVYRTESALTSEYAKQRDLNSRLTRVVENLLTDFPNYRQEFVRLMNSLKIPIFAVCGIGH